MVWENTTWLALRYFTGNNKKNVHITEVQLRCLADVLLKKHQSEEVYFSFCQWFIIENRRNERQRMCPLWIFEKMWEFVWICLFSALNVMKTFNPRLGLIIQPRQPNLFYVTSACLSGLFWHVAFQLRSPHISSSYWLSLVVVLHFLLQLLLPLLFYILSCCSCWRLQRMVGITLPVILDLISLLTILFNCDSMQLLCFNTAIVMCLS